MKLYGMLLFGLILIPLLYALGVLWYRPSFQKEENQNRRPLRTPVEWVAVAAAELAFLRIWYTVGRETDCGLQFQLLMVMLAGMLLFCMTDLWERIVPNALLGIFVLVFFCLVGLSFVRDSDKTSWILYSVVLGFLFSLLTFGLGYILSRKNMGAGDVKLALLMGLYLTGEYVVGAILYGCMAAAIFSIVQMLRKKLSRKDILPFVPFLYIGVILRYLIG
ncbi:MAG: A24 family peptidase [bacterium]|nr:A24 family peptidase [bacterium]